MAVTYAPAEDSRRAEASDSGERTTAHVGGSTPHSLLRRGVRGARLFLSRSDRAPAGVRGAAAAALSVALRPPGVTAYPSAAYGDAGDGGDGGAGASPPRAACRCAATGVLCASANSVFGCARGNAGTADSGGACACGCGCTAACCVICGEPARLPAGELARLPGRPRGRSTPPATTLMPAPAGASAARNDVGGDASLSLSTLTSARLPSDDAGAAPPAAAAARRRCSAESLPCRAQDTPRACASSAASTASSAPPGWKARPQGGGSGERGEPPASRETALAAGFGAKRDVPACVSRAREAVRRPSGRLVVGAWCATAGGRQRLGTHPLAWATAPCAPGSAQAVARPREAGARRAAGQRETAAGQLPEVGRPPARRRPARAAAARRSAATRRPTRTRRPGSRQAAGRRCRAGAR